MQSTAMKTIALSDKALTLIEILSRCVHENKNGWIDPGVFFFGAAVCLAADPQAGTWRLNESKSKITPGTLKTTQVVYSSMFGQVKVKSEGIDANGKPIHFEWSGKIDGKDYPLTGDPNSDTRSYTKVNDRTLTTSQ